ncbi:MAG TPA: ABC transporter substrate-binding protein [Candidatus Sulfotelmatobacter sp.]|nr:ABC transporter substrate-binding protein [Candidatus Sulfotelmatobacter sp.]
MTERPRSRHLAAAVAAGILLLVAGLRLAHAGTTVPIGYVEITDDPRYDDKWAYAGLLLAPGGRPVAGAELALDDININGQAFNLQFALQKAEAPDAKGMIAAIQKLEQADNVHLFLIDAADAILTEVAKALRDAPVLLLNVSAESDGLRAEACQPNLLHTIPSYAMRMDALAEFLTAKKWRQVLVLQGPLPDDAVLAAAFDRSAKKFGLEIADTRKFRIGNDPRNRDQDNLALLTSGVDYDVVFVADSDGEFGRYLPYATQLPRPVVGTAGLTAVAWYWAFESYGAAQLTRRFYRHAKRQMQEADWAAWVAVRALGDAVMHTHGADVAAVGRYLRSDSLALDGSKGTALNFRSWDNQLRQPILLADSNWVVAEAPLPQFQHATNNLDTLGIDKPESKCHF